MVQCFKSGLWSPTNGLNGFLLPVMSSWSVYLTTLSLKFLIYKIGKRIPDAIVVRLKQHI